MPVPEEIGIKKKKKNKRKKDEINIEKSQDAHNEPIVSGISGISGEQLQSSSPVVDPSPPAVLG